MKLISMLLGMFLAVGCNSSKKTVEVPQENKKIIMQEEILTKEVATLGGGCFWCIEAIFDELEGVDTVISGYAGGKIENPTYDQVCNEHTGHVEVVQIEFNPQVISYQQLLDIFWHVHNPTTLNRQGNDVGEQYRSVVFYHSEKQKQQAETSLQESQDSQLWGNAKYTTTIEPIPTFYSAEKYHQDYFSNNPTQPYCSAVVAPKVQKFREKYKDLLKE